MSVKLTNRSGNKVTLELSLTLNDSSMLQSEELIQKTLNEAGQLLSLEALSNFDTDGKPIMVKGKQMTSKGQLKKKHKRPTDQ